MGSPKVTNTLQAQVLDKRVGNS